MTSRIQFEDWQLLAPVIGFALTFIAFVYFSIRAAMMKKADRDRMAHLPLEDQPKEFANNEKESRQPAS